MTAVDELSCTIVDLDGVRMPAGSAVHKVIRAQKPAWIHVDVGTEEAGTVYRITNMRGQGEVRLPIVPPKTKTEAARCNENRAKARAKAREG